MKKIIALALALVLCLSLAACGAKGPSLADIKKAGKMTVATSPDFPPFESLENNEVVGIEVDIMKLVAKDLGVEIEFVQMDFDSVLVGIQSAKYDCAMSGITVTPDREKNMLFTDPYYNAAQVIVVAEGSPITGKADLADKVASVQTGTTAESGCQDEGSVSQHPPKVRKNAGEISCKRCPFQFYGVGKRKCISNLFERTAYQF